jgi:uncharacterized membrane protein HdeD (DUF308 family)
MVGGVVLTALGASSLVAGAVSDSSIAYLFGGVVIVAGLVEIVHGAWKRKGGAR